MHIIIISIFPGGIGPKVPTREHVRDQYNGMNRQQIMAELIVIHLQDHQNKRALSCSSFWWDKFYIYCTELYTELLKENKTTSYEHGKSSNNSNLHWLELLFISRASDIFWKKKQNFAGFLGTNSRKNRLILRDFHGTKVKICEKSANFAWKKSKLVEKSANFAGFSQEKSQDSERKINRFCWILAEKSQISKDFGGQILRKIAQFHGKFQGETSPRNNQLKAADFPGFSLANFTKIDQFCVNMTSVV